MSLYVQQLNVSIIINYALYLFLHVVAVLFLVVVRASDTRHVLALLVGPRLSSRHCCMVATELSEYWSIITVIGVITVIISISSFIIFYCRRLRIIGPDIHHPQLHSSAVSNQWRILVKRSTDTRH